MRQKKFKGQRIDTKEWVYGGYFEATEEDGYFSYIYTCHDGAVRVIPESVGQFIGVKGYKGEYNERHNNEVDLYEGDIVEAWSEGSKGRFIIKMRIEATPSFILYPAWQSSKMWGIAASDLGRKKEDYYDDLKVIGNVHNQAAR